MVWLLATPHGAFLGHVLVQWCATPSGQDSSLSGSFKELLREQSGLAPDSLHRSIVRIKSTRIDPSEEEGLVRRQVLGDQIAPVSSSKPLSELSAESSLRPWLYQMLRNAERRTVYAWQERTLICGTRPEGEVCGICAVYVLRMLKC